MTTSVTAPSLRTGSVAGRRTPQLLAALVVAWLAVVVALSAAGVFTGPASSPPIALGIFSAGPPLAVLVALLVSPRVRAWARAADLRMLTQLQMLRVAGFTLLALGVVGTLPRSFALPAGIGDVFVALTAPLVATFVLGTRRRWIFVAWTVFGILDLIDAVTLGVLDTSSTIGLLHHGSISADAMGTLPLSVIPVFGVPFTMILHLLSLPHLRRWHD
ncbi:hypothetical protein [Nocardia macrotermitis]|uniref:Uncharacterized protein n=1 Tax=Nocardia macrotermitis TaxID=2585198 RepID=A0A7K0D2P9_9NOCA|nr:hypothetical protein [Nocardia macrotermitis]MQY19931.1 hypothetical protein [Nocardia macrotermitis]